jgi:phenylalanyl-tRNA synthetase beta chain
MRLPLSWLREFVEVDVPAETLARMLTDSVAEVEEVRVIGGEWDPQLVRVGRVVAIEPHPNADRLKLATVDLGDSIHRVVCGAPNIAPGQHVAFALEGARIVDGRTGQPAVLRRATIRGVESAGMVLSERELGLGEDHSGILVLPDSAPVGRPLVEVLGDVVFELSTWANRADLLGVLGLAREVAALLGKELREPPRTYTAEGPAIEELAEVVVEAPDLCRRFTAAVVTDLTIEPSPRWLQERLERMGMRPINNVVDITNYVMLETGQPLHAFDYEAIGGRKVVARRARPGERIVTLDGVERELDPDMLLICDAERPLGIAGIMGGAESEVNPRTRTILLEVANFHPGSIRRTSMRLKLRTEASSRFEKGIGPGMAVYAQARALHLLQEVCGGRIARGTIDLYPTPVEPAPIELPEARIGQVLGMEVPDSEVRRILTALGFRCEADTSARTYQVTPPFWRTDVAIADDVIEEIARVHGYDKLPTTSLRGALPEPEADPVRELRHRLADAFVAVGFHEVITYSLTDAEELRRTVAPDDTLRNRPLAVVNPVAAQHTYLRTTLRGSLLRTYARNRPHAQGPLQLFEIGVEFLPRDGDLPDERPVLVAAMGGFRPDRWGHPSDERLDFFDLKGALESVLEGLWSEASFEPAEEHGFLAGHTAAVLVSGQRVGILGQVHPDVAAAFDIGEPVYLLELGLRELAAVLPERPAYQPPPRFPPVRLDLALVVEAGLPAAQLLRAVRSHRSGSVTIEADLFDEYRGPGIPEGKKSLALHLRLQAPDRTLTDAEAKRVVEGLLARLERELGARPRAAL